MFSFISRWWDNRIIRRSSISSDQWQQAFRRLPLLDRLDDTQRKQLIRMSILFLHVKSLEGARNLTLTDEMRLVIALQACLPVLNLGLGWYRGWTSIIVYPAQFIPRRKYIDEYGIEHHSESVLSGESWHSGPVVLSWEDTQHAGVIDGYNLVIHEFAHKLDVLNGSANGFPPLHRGMDSRQWVRAFSEAYDDLKGRLTHGQEISMDSYAASSPAEFFAVASEVFFERPDNLIKSYPRLYEQLKYFYRQDPASPADYRNH